MAQSSPDTTTTTAALLAGYLHAAGVRHVSGSVVPLRSAMLMLAVGHERPAGPFGSMDPLAPPARAPINSPAPRH